VNRRTDRVPSRAEMKNTPGSYCLMCRSRLSISPSGKTWLIGELGAMSRTICRSCPSDRNDMGEYC